jgi:MinD-like ATPase involved in chromosome partitioning or flagellar assembly
MYSYKGGAGRTVSTANIAGILAKDYNKKVVCIDLDIEGAGLSVVFNVHKDVTGSKDRKCLQDVLSSKGFKSAQDFQINWWPNLHCDIGKNVALPEMVGNLLFIPARFAGFDVVAPAEETMRVFESLLTEIRNQIKPDFILLDSASGLGDMACMGLSVCDVLVIFMRWSRQFVEGTIETIKFLQSRYNAIGVILIVPSAVPSLDGDDGKYERVLKSNHTRITIETGARKGSHIRLLDGVGEAIGLKWEEKVLNMESSVAKDENNTLEDFRNIAKTLIELE